MRKTAAFLTSLLLWGASSAQAEPRIHWEVADRFRLFDQADPEARARVEALLDVLAQTPPEEALRPAYDQILETLSGDPARSLRRSNWRWSPVTDAPGTRVYEPGYLTPAVYRIRARLSEAPAGADCVWTVDGTAGAAGPCGAEVLLEIAAGLAEGRRGAAAEISIRTADDVEIARETVTVEDALIVALGDSFVSGEGNPDRPAVYEPFPASEDFARADWPTRIHPGLVTRAEWWDEPCHRSLLSWPVLAALSEAARSPRRATTLVHLGCSGAEAKTGLYGPQEDLPGGGGEKKGQFEQLDDLLRPSGRAVDRLFLSIGGNDVGFVPVIEYAVIPPNGYGWGPFDPVAAAVVGRFWSAKGPIRPYRGDALPLGVLGGFRESAESRFKRMPDEYDKVQQGLEDLGVRLEAVLQTTYPDILRDRNGDFCRTTLTDYDLQVMREGRWWFPADPDQADREEAFRRNHPGNELGGFEVLLGQVPEPLRGDRWRFQFQYTPDISGDCDLVALGSDSEVCKAYWVWSRLNEAVSENAGRWRIVPVHERATNGHGWCETKPGDSLRFPRAVPDRDGGWMWEGGREPHHFDPYDPEMGRWFRTANDSALTQYGGPERHHQGSVHPTFNAHIAYAEAVLKAAADQAGSGPAE